MRRVTKTGQDGKPVVELIPETDADRAELERMIRERQADGRDAFSDDPNVWRKGKRKGRG